MSGSLPKMDRSPFRRPDKNRFFAEGIRKESPSSSRQYSGPKNPEQTRRGTE